MPLSELYRGRFTTVDGLLYQFRESDVLEPKSESHRTERSFNAILNHHCVHDLSSSRRHLGDCFSRLLGTK